MTRNLGGVFDDGVIVISEGTSHIKQSVQRLRRKFLLKVSLEKQILFEMKRVRLKIWMLMLLHCLRLSSGGEPASMVPARLHAALREPRSDIGSRLSTCSAQALSKPV